MLHPVCMYLLICVWYCYLSPLASQDKGGGPREVIVSWVALLERANEERTALGEAGKALNPAHLTCGERGGRGCVHRACISEFRQTRGLRVVGNEQQGASRETIACWLCVHITT